MDTSMNITPNEAAVLYAIAYNEMNSCNYGKPKKWQDTTTYTWTLSDGAFGRKGSYGSVPGLSMPKGKALSGTISSLVQKGLVNSGDDELIQLTESGFDTWLNYPYAN